jgi:hypothetical protein
MTTSPTEAQTRINNIYQLNKYNGYMSSTGNAAAQAATAAITTYEAITTTPSADDLFALRSGLFDARNMAETKAQYNAINQVFTQVELEAIGGALGVCRAGATHVVYSCSVVDSVMTVGSVIATNDCTITGKIAAEQSCYSWGSQSGVDLYASYDGATCSYFLGANAVGYCLAGLDHIA